MAEPTMTTHAPLLAVDGTPLKKKLRQALFASRLRALALVMPLLVFILIGFAAPIAVLLWQGVHNDEFSATLPRTTAYLAKWDGKELPDEPAFAALVEDMREAYEIDRNSVSKAGMRVNRELPGTLSLFRPVARDAKKMEAPFKEALLAKDQKWGELATWQAMKVASQTLTTAYYAAALDADLTAEGTYVRLPENERIYITLFLRTLWVAAIVTFFCIVLGYPVAWLLANLPMRTANLLMILVLLPFWTSLLVRTTAWIAMLQSEGVVNSLLVWAGVINPDGRLQLIYNLTGTVIAMTHILLPFMILPLYSVMKTIPPSYLRAAKSLGATPTTAFLRVYVPQTVPGLGAGGLLVFILAIGYYITPALLGGEEGTLISNMIAFHMQKSLNWSLAAALSGLLLAGVLLLYWVYDRLIGIDNMKLG